MFTNQTKQTQGAGVGAYCDSAGEASAPRSLTLPDRLSHVETQTHAHAQGFKELYELMNSRLRVIEQMLGIPN